VQLWGVVDRVLMLCLDNASAYADHTSAVHRSSSTSFLFVLRSRGNKVVPAPATGATAGDDTVKRMPTTNAEAAKALGSSAAKKSVLQKTGAKPLVLPSAVPGPAVQSGLISTPLGLEDLVGSSGIGEGMYMEGNQRTCTYGVGVRSSNPDKTTDVQQHVLCTGKLRFERGGCHHAPQKVNFSNADGHIAKASRKEQLLQFRRGENVTLGVVEPFQVPTTHLQTKERVMPQSEPSSAFRHRTPCTLHVQ
jgi:hypothetical protein